MTAQIETSELQSQNIGNTLDDKIRNLGLPIHETLQWVASIQDAIRNPKAQTPAQAAQVTGYDYNTVNIVEEAELSNPVLNAAHGVSRALLRFGNKISTFAKGVFRRNGDTTMVEPHVDQIDETTERGLHSNGGTFAIAESLTDQIDEFTELAPKSNEEIFEEDENVKVSERESENSIWENIEFLPGKVDEMNGCTAFFTLHSLAPDLVNLLIGNLNQLRYQNQPSILRYIKGNDGDLQIAKPQLVVSMRSKDELLRFLNSLTIDELDWSTMEQHRITSIEASGLKLSDVKRIGKPFKYLNTVSFIDNSKK